MSVVRGATTSGDLDNLYRHIATEIGAVRSEMKGEIATVMAEFRVAEATRSTEFQQVQSDFSDLKKTLPSKEDISRSTRNWALGLAGFTVAIAGLLWAFFGTGASLTGALADRIVDTKSQQEEIERKLDRLLEVKLNDHTERSPREGQAGSVHPGAPVKP